MRTFIKRPVMTVETHVEVTEYTNPGFFDRVFRKKKPEPKRTLFYSGRSIWSACIAKFEGEELQWNSDTMEKIPELTIEDLTLRGVFPTVIEDCEDGSKIYTLRFDNCVDIIGALKRDY